MSETLRKKNQYTYSTKYLKNFYELSGEYYKIIFRQILYIRNLVTRFHMQLTFTTERCCS